MTDGTESFVIRALSTVSECKLRFHSLVRCSLENDPQATYYIGLANHLFVLLDRNMLGKNDGGLLLQCSYSSIEVLAIDTEHVELFELKLLPDAPEVLSGLLPSPRLFFCCPDRERLVKELAVCIRASYMFTYWNVPSNELIVDADVPWEDMKGTDIGGADFTSPTGDEERFSVQDYFFFASTRFSIREEQRGGVGVFGQDEDFKRAFFEVHCDDADLLAEDQGVAAVKSAAEAAMRRCGELVKDYRVIGEPRRYHKKMNLTGDPASWDCWLIHIRAFDARYETEASQRTANRDIAIITLRRKYIPPVMEAFQDMVVLYYGAQRNFDTAEGSFLAQAECIADSLSPCSRGFECDMVVVQTKADALLLDEEAYDWLATRLRVQPRGVKFAKAFCKSILNLLRKAGLEFTSEGVFEDVNVDGDQDDPFEFALLFEKNRLGLSDTAPAALVEAWKERVWRYLAFCVDGGLLTGSLTIQDLVYQFLVLTNHKRARNKVAQLLETFLYLRGTNAAFEQVPLAQKVADERLMRSFTFNERVMERLLATNYIKNVLDATGDRSEFPRFMVRLLRRESLSEAGGKVGRQRLGASLQYAVCKQLVSNSMGETGQGGGSSQRAMDELSLNTLVPTLIELLHASDDNLKVLAVVALVNFTQNNPAVKQLVMSGGAVRAVVRFLASKHEDLIRHSCSLLNNCTKSEQYRQTVASFGSIPLLMRLLERSKNPPHYFSGPILIQASAVIGNLASDSRLRDQITECLGLEKVEDANFSRKFEQPVAIRVLIDLLQNESEIRTHRDKLHTTVIFALKNLAIRHEENKKTIGRLAIRTVLDIAKNASKDESILLDVALRFIYVLSFNQNNCHLLHKFDLDSLLEQPKTAGFREQVLLSRARC